MNTETDPKSNFDPSSVSLRDLIAVHALTGLLMHPERMDWTIEEIAKDAYDIANVMLKEREKDALKEGS